MQSHDSASSIGGKTEWLAWFTGLSVCATIIGLVFKFGSDSAGDLAGDLLVLLILGLFCTTLYKSYRDISRLDRETRLASEQVAELQRVNDIAQFLQSAQASIFRSHIAALHTIFLSHSSISQDTVLDIAHARLRARNKVVDLLASILITLGLIGTILGLLIAVSGLSGVLGGSGGGSGQEADIIASLQTVIEGLGTAFHTTLFGAAAGGVILRILTSVVDSHILRYVAHISELTEVYVLPALRRRAAQLEADGYYRDLDHAG